MKETFYDDFWEGMFFMSSHGFLEYVVLIGSWAEFIYQKSGFLQDYPTELRTMDIDILIRNRKKA